MQACHLLCFLGRVPPAICLIQHVGIDILGRKINITIQDSTGVVVRST